MAMRIGRTLPPAAAPLKWKNIVSGVAGLIGGVKTVRRFEEELKSYYGVRHCFAVSSGKAALVLVLQALHKLKPERDEVLIPAYTCYSVPSAIIRAGLKVRLCDMATGSLDFDFGQLEEQLDDPRILCVMPTHLFGLPADVERVRNLVNHRGIFIVEDAAQAMGGERDGKRLGTVGDVGIFSLGRGKAFSTVEGGIIITGDNSIGLAIQNELRTIPEYDTLDCLKLIFYAIALSVLIHPRIYWLPKSVPFLKLGETHFEPFFTIRRMSSFQAGIARGWENRIEALKVIRSSNANEIVAYGVVHPGISNTPIPALIRFPVLAKDAEVKSRILQKSEKMGMGISDGYPGSIDGIIELQTVLIGKGFPVANDIAERLISLPVHPFVSKGDILKIVQSLE